MRLGRGASRRLPVGLLAVLCAAAIGVGCGGGGEEERTLPVSSLSGAKFVERADAICARGRERALRYQPSLPGGRTGASIAEAIDASVLPALRQVVDRIYALGVARSEHRQVEVFLTTLTDALDRAEGLEVPSFERLEPLLRRPGTLARRLSLEDCVYG